MFFYVHIVPKIQLIRFSSFLLKIKPISMLIYRTKMAKYNEDYSMVVHVP